MSVERLEKARVVTEQVIVAVTTNKATTGTLVSAFMANISGMMTKENTVFFLSAILILSQIAANIYKGRLYKKLTKQDYVDINPDDVEQIVSKRQRREHKREQ